MIKTTVSTTIICAVIAGVWLSISTSLRTNQDASTTLVTSLKTDQDTSITRILSLLDRSQQQIKMGVDQNLQVSSNLLGALEAMNAISQQNQKLDQQNHDLAQQNKQLAEQMSAILKQHTQTLNDANKKADAALHEVQRGQVRTQRIIRQIAKPKPTPAPKWFWQH